METIVRRSVLGALLLAGLLAAWPRHGTAAADTTQRTGGPYAVNWSSATAGGVTFLEAGGYWLGNTVGQSSAGSVAGSPFELDGGFWVAGDSDTLFRDGFESGDTSRWNVAVGN